VTNIGTGDHLGLRGNETPEESGPIQPTLDPADRVKGWWVRDPQELARVKQTVVQAVAPGGAAVLNADDPLTAAIAEQCPGKVIYLAHAAGHPVIPAHRRGGGRAVFVRDGAIILAEGEREEMLISLARVPLTHRGWVAFQVENALAAAAAVWALATPLDA